MTDVAAAPTPLEAAALTSQITAGLDLGGLTSLYRDLHQNPELSFQETRTAGIVAGRLQRAGATVTTGVGRTGVVGILENGPGPTILARADMDGLPIRELTGLDYASRAVGTTPAGAETPVMHACGHDVHVSAMLGTVDLLATNRDAWQGTLMVIGQPAEEIGEGARAMLLDGLYDRFGLPDLALAQHVEVFEAGSVAHRETLFASGAVTLEVVITGRDGHASTPEVSIDPIVVSAASIMRLQTIVAREIAAPEAAVVSVTSINGGASGNTIPASVRLTVNLRFQSERVRTHLVEAVQRIIRAECLASNCPEEPTFTERALFPCVVNDDPLSTLVRETHAAIFGPEKVHDRPASMGSEDFSFLSGPEDVGHRIPSCYWEIGGLAEELWAQTDSEETFERRIAVLPGLHSAYFVPAPIPALTTGVKAMVGAVLAAPAACRR